MKYFACILLVVLAFSWSCRKGSFPTPSQEILSTLSYEVMLPAYEAFSEEADHLEEVTAAFAASPDANSLEECRQAWKDARLAWSECEAYLIGPESDLLLPAKIATFPVLTANIEAIVSGVQTIDSDMVEALGSNRKGFFAIEYLLFDGSADASAILDLMTNSSDATRRRALLAAYASNLSDVADTILGLWQGGFADDFSRAGMTGSSLATQKAAFDKVINRMIFLTEQSADSLLGNPLELANDGMSGSIELPSALSAHTRVELKEQVYGLLHLFNGNRKNNPGIHPQDHGLTAKTSAVSPEIDDDLRETFRDTLEAIDAIPETLLDSFTAHPDEVEEAFNAMKNLKSKLLTELVTAFDSTLTFSPFDGD